MDIVAIIREYGLAGVAVVLHIPLYTLLWGKKKEIDSIPDIKEAVDNVHLECHIPRGAVKSLESEIAELKRTDTKLEERFTEKFKSLEDAISEMRGDVKAIYNILLSWKK